MLDAETKRRIDACRDILVGKVPNPQSQVEQITIALIYKFMDDMDAETEEMGGARSFFAGDFARFGWKQLMAPSLGGFDMLTLYSEAIQKMNENPGVPPLFRDIFKNAYLPYRDPETLKSFLKEINYFTYDHSEKLGDAFEYLLSVLGSQGDAGQFRTPRHIIDFMVEVMDPKKNETIMDPACGTAGFLISAWKHILQANTSAKQKNTGRAGDLLTPDERARLASSIYGYDISPDMVRLSLVNLYLHGFTNPRVHEYDTLTQDDKWNEVADVILANPPFMSPKGGIKPHKRFSVQATRSEVLFVDYMAEHLTATGRAAIVVPEGIIFQSGTAYKALRKMLVDTSLVAVVSLPAGVFNPYSGVKTSILILDKRVHKQTDKVLFVKVQNDGYNLGAQRRAVANSDLPAATRLLRGWLIAPDAFEGDGVVAQAVARERISEGGNFNLSGERYVVGVVATSSYKFAELGEVVDILDSRRRPITKSDRISGPYPYYGATGVLDHVHDFLFDEPLVLIGEDGAKWESGDKTAFAVSGKTWVNNHAHVVRPQRDKLLDVYLIEMLRQMDLSPFITGVTVPKLNQEKLRGIQIPLPPLEVQHQIVAEIEGYQKVIDGARQVVESYKPQIAIDPTWSLKSLGEIFKTKSGTTPSRSNSTFFVGGKIPWVKTLDLRDGPLRETEECVTELALTETHLEKLPQGTVLVAMYGGLRQIGRTGVLEIEATINQAMTALLPTPEVDPYFLNAVLISQRAYWKSVANSTRKDPNITKSDVLNFMMPLPSIETQRAIVAEIEAEQVLVNANRELIQRMEAKIKTAIDRVWGVAI
jgi:type I restriction enzyme M protein